MRFHKRHRIWLIFALLVLGGGNALYRHERQTAPFGPSGGSAIGLIFGGVAAGLILFAALRGLRRWLPSGPIASDGWARAHHWLGLLVVPLAWFHGGFRHGGALTCATMWLLYAIVISGGVGAVLRLMTSRRVNDPAPDEPADEPLEESMRRLGARAEGAVASAPVARCEPLKEFYAMSIQPYLEGTGGEMLASRVKAGQLLRRYRGMLPDEFHATMIELERVCDDCRRLRLRARLQQYVDRWMLIHGPLSLALVILVALHGGMAVRY